MSKIEAVVCHNKHDYIARKNAEKYIGETMESKIKNKYSQVRCITMKSIENDVLIDIDIEGHADEGSINLISNKTRKVMKNFSKRYNSNCYIK